VINPHSGRDAASDGGRVRTTPSTAPEPLSSQPIHSLRDSELYQLWRERVVLDDNDLIIAVAASTRTEISGTGKSTLGVTLAQAFDNTDAGFNAEEKATLSATEVANDFYQNLPNQSAIVFDEAQGTTQTDGVDARRAMADSVRNMSQAAAQYRKRQHTLIIVAQTTDWIDSRMMDLIDRLVLIQEKDPQREFARAVTFSHYRDDLPSASGSASEYTPAVEDLFWEPLPEDDPDYQTIEQLKEQAGTAESADEDGSERLPLSLADLPTKQRDHIIHELVSGGITHQDIADIVGVSRRRVTQIAQKVESGDR